MLIGGSEWAVQYQTEGGSFGLISQHITLPTMPETMNNSWPPAGPVTSSARPRRPPRGTSQTGYSSRMVLDELRITDKLWALDLDRRLHRHERSLNLTL
jgi:hypothetical protein